MNDDEAAVHGTVAPVNDVLERAKAAMADLDWDDPGVVTEECKGRYGNYDAGTYASSRAISATASDPSILDAMIEALPDAWVLRDSDHHLGTTDEPGRLVELAVDRDNHRLRITAGQQNGEINVTVESRCE